MEKQEASRCVHRWVLGEEVRGRVRGVCRRCGAHRWYPAFPEGATATYDGVDRLTARRPALASGTAPLDELDRVSDLPLDGVALSLSETEAVW